MTKTTRQAGQGATVGPTDISPHEGWEVHSQKYGFMRTDDGESLVSLVDLVRWLMHVTPIHRAGAIRIVLDGLRPSALPSIYFTSRDEAAVSYSVLDSGPWAEFGPSVPVRYMGATRDGVPSLGLQEWLRQPLEDQKLDLLRDRIESEVTHWMTNPEGLADPQTTKSILSISMTKAAELWGYGLPAQSSPASVQPLTWPALVAARNGKKGEPWTHEALQLLASEKARRGPGAVASMAAELGVTVEAINGALRRTRKRQPAPVVGRVVRLSGAEK